ncbi:MAG: hypothetical protein WBE90_15665 [Xanthobacteraceae bacterium]
MTDQPDPFAPIDEWDLTDDLQASKTSSDSVVVTPVPAEAERVGDAATRLFGRPPDNFWRYHDEDRRQLFVVARWNLAGGKKKYFPMCWVRRTLRREIRRTRVHE